MQPQTHYAKSEDLNIAYQVVGDGPFDLVYVPGWVSNIEYVWEEPRIARALERLASFSRLILFDKRGTGLSDRVPDDQLPTVEERMDDVRAVLDAAGSRQAALFGVSEGANMSVVFAATHPERTRALVTFGAFAKRVWSPDYPWAPTAESRQEWFEKLEQGWGGVVDIDTMAPSLAGDEPFRQWWSAYLRRSASPKAALALARMNTAIDIRAVLPTVHVPTLVLHRKGDRDAHIGGSRFIASRVPGAKLVELEGDDHLWYVGETDMVVEEIQEFLTGTREVAEPERVLTTVLFTDIVDSTKLAAQMGDARWVDLLGAHRSLAHREFARFRGREVETTGDGFLVTFDGPARAVRCAVALAAAVKGLGLSIRAGVHTGECEIIGAGLGGIAVHIAARVLAHAAPGEVVVSSTVRDLVSGAGIRFATRGSHALKGVPGQWELLAVET